jgi:hypothetical protein
MTLSKYHVKILRHNVSSVQVDDDASSSNFTSGVIAPSELAAREKELAP